MKAYIVALGVLLPAYAWAGDHGVTAPGASATTTSTSASSARAAARSSSHSTSSARGGNASTTTTVNSTSGGGGNTDGSRRPPDLVGPSLSSGNPCSVGGGGGAGWSFFGAMFSWMTESDRCSLREDARLLYAMGDAAAAKQAACANPWIEDGYAKAGQPCERTVERWRKAGWKP